MEPRKPQPTQASLRKVLLRVLVDRSQFDRLCVDYYDSLVQKIDPRSSLDDAITALFKYSETSIILESIEAEPDWASRLAQYRHLLTYKKLEDSDDIKNPSADAAGAIPHRRRLPAFAPNLGQWLLIGAMVMGGTAGAVVWFARHPQQWSYPASASSPVASPSAPQVQATTAAATPAPAAAPAPAATPAPAAAPAPVLAGPPTQPHSPPQQPRHRPQPKPSTTKPQPASLPPQPTPHCDSSDCPPTGSDEHRERLLREGIAACSKPPPDPITAQTIYDRLLPDPDRQQKMKAACDAAKVEVR